MPKTNPADTDLISMREAMSRYHVSRDTIRRRIADGSITAYRLGPKLIRIDRAEADALLRRIRKAG
jgi:excisionase family DNA binding protein